MINKILSNNRPGFSALQLDFHSHLLPGIDDGARDLEESLELIRGLMEMGFRRIVTSPHVSREYYPNTSAEIRSREAAVQQALEERGWPVQFAAAAEYYLDEGFGQLLKAKDLLPVGPSSILVEMGFMFPASKLHHYLFELQMKGYQPILAHPERYLYYKDEFEQYYQIREWGCRFQMNILSLAGYYGKPVRNNAVRLLKKGLVDFLGTDLHNAQQLEELKNSLKDRRVRKALGMAFLNEDIEVSK